MVMSKRQQAPGELERVRAFVNTADLEEGTDELSAPPRLTAWIEAQGLAEPGLTATRADLRRAVRLREALRAILVARGGRGTPPATAGETLDSLARRAKLQLHFDRDGVSDLWPEADGVDGALGRLLAIVHAAAADGSWVRLKACRDPGCEWAFYDHTKNRSGAWCDMAECGSRAKARAYRERRSGAARWPRRSPDT
jgi:predicted RNA-binding Zn ribbon-like protein